MKTKLILALFVGVFSALVAAPSHAAEKRSPIIGKGSVLTKRIALTYIHGHSVAAKARHNAIKAKLGK